jgi:putative transposase
VKRAACEHAQRFGPMSERRASVLVDIHRSTLHYRPKLKNDEAIRKRMRELAYKYHRWGCPQLHVILKREGLVVNRKRTERIYREEKLSLRTKKRKKRPTIRISMPPATGANQVWAMDFIDDRLMDGRKLKSYTLIDEYTKESLAIVIDTSIGGQRVVQVLDQVAGLRGYPQSIRSDNGPEFTCKALFSWTDSNKVTHVFIEPGKPTQNPFIESFHDKFRDEFLNENWFATLKAARIAAAEWRQTYNGFRPHSTLDGLTPCEFARRLLIKDQFKDQDKVEQQQQTALKTPLMTGT